MTHSRVTAGQRRVENTSYEYSLIDVAAFLRCLGAPFSIAKEPCAKNNIDFFG
jgi:hypothetical protein